MAWVVIREFQCYRCKYDLNMSFIQHRVVQSRKNAPILSLRLAKVGQKPL